MNHEYTVLRKRGMKYPSWNDFLGKNSGSPEDAFEALCRFLFRTKYGIGDSLPYFFNNAGNETVPINVGNEVIGFQSKFFDDDTIGDSQANQIKHSIEAAHSHYPKQNKIIIYTKSTFGNPTKGSLITKKQKDIEKTAKDCSMAIEWMFGDNILDVVAKMPLAYSLFFDLDSNLNHLPQSLKKLNQLNFNNISSSIKYEGNVIEIDRSKEVSEIKELISNGRNVLVYGESGSGKSAIVKRYWHESIEDQEQIIYFTRGSQFDANSVNDLFLMDEEYSYVGFRDVFDGFANKIVIIDSAEKLTEIENRMVLQLLLEGLNEKGWQFIFTCKSNTYDEIRSLLRDLKVSVEDVSVDALQEEELCKFGKKYHIDLPQNEKVFQQLRIPFYLARYCELGSVSIATPEAFKEEVWKQKVRGTVRGGEQRKREECLLQIVKEQQARNAYFVNPAGLDYDAAYKLVLEDVLIEQVHKGYAVKHDLYVDWALEYLVEQDFGKEENCVKIIKEIPPSITYLNAFARWLMCIIDTNDRRVGTIMDTLVRGDVDKRWVHCLLSCVGNSRSYATSFFSLYDISLKAQNYFLFDQFVDILDVSCKKVTQYFEFKGERYPIYKSVGKGWDEAVVFVFANKDDYYLNHLGSVQKLLDGYSSFGNKGAAMTQAAELSLYLFDYIADNRKKEESIWVDGLNKWCELTCKYAFGIRKELHEVFRQVIDNRWVRHRDPYAELISYILKDQNHVSKTMLYITCLDVIIELMELFWREQPEEDNQHVFGYSRTMESEHLFGLNEEDGIHMAFFPSSPYQTPVQMLFEAEQLLNPTEKTTKVVDFIVRFVNQCVDYYFQRCKYEQVVKIPVQFTDGSSHMVIASQSLWNMYRGTANLSMPNVLESIHMALEVYLLDMTDRKKNPDWNSVKELLWRILTTSHSASLYSIVASVAVAHPDDLFDILLFLCQNIQFLALDLNRCSHEITSNSRSFIYNRHESWWTERDQSNKLPHRQEHLESILLKSQVVYDNAEDDDSKQRLQKAYHVVDELKRQVDNMNDADSIYGFIAARIDYRTHKKHEVVLENGVVAVQLTPDLSPELKAESKEAEELANKMEAMSVRVWADKTFKGDNNSLKGNQYAADPKKVLTVIRDIERQIEKQSGDMILFPGDEYVPYMASAVLLMHCQDILSDREKKECWKRVLLALKSPGAMASNSVSEFNICISAIPTMMELYPKKADVFAPIIASYVSETYTYINERVCDIMSRTIHDGQLWEKYPSVMDGALELIRVNLPNEDFGSMDASNADAVFCLLTYEPLARLRGIGKTCLDKLSSKWQIQRRYEQLEGKSKIADNVAKYLLFAPQDDLIVLIRPFIPFIGKGSYGEPLITNLLLNTPQYGKYDNFWTIWHFIYDKVTEHRSWFYQDEVLNEYLLNPLFFRRDYDDWFRLEIRDLEFFAKIGKEMGDHPAVVFAISRVFATIGKCFSKEAIGILSQLIEQHNPSLKDSQKTVLYYLNKIVKKVYTENISDIRGDMRFKGQFTIVLEFMRSNGSTEASNILMLL